MYIFQTSDNCGYKKRGDLVREKPVSGILAADLSMPNLCKMLKIK
jgi:hypothetical protein